MRRPLKVVRIVAGILCATVVLLFTFCQFSYEEIPNADVYIQDLGDCHFELAFTYKVKISGNMHGPSLPFKTSTYDNAKWFYLSSCERKLDAKDIILTNYRNCEYPLYWQRDMRGTIELTEDVIRFSIEMPRYDMPDGTVTDTVQRYVTWEHNGEYRLVRRAPPPIKGPDFDYRPASCGGE